MPTDFISRPKFSAVVAELLCLNEVGLSFCRLAKCFISKPAILISHSHQFFSRLEFNRLRKIFNRLRVVAQFKMSYAAIDIGSMIIFFAPNRLRTIATACS